MSSDSCDDEGARKLKAKIEAFWATQGFGDPGVDLVKAGFVPAMRSARTDVRSGMVNGMPQGRTVKQKIGVQPPATPEDKPPPFKPGSIRTRKQYER